jgi:hypothetical protein
MKTTFSLILLFVTAFCSVRAASPIYDADASLVLVPTAVAGKDAPHWLQIPANQVYGTFCDFMVGSTGTFRTQHGYLLPERLAFLDSVSSMQVTAPAKGGTQEPATGEVGFSIEITISSGSLQLNGFVAQPSADMKQVVRRKFADHCPLVEGGATILRGLIFQTEQGPVEAVLFLKIWRHAYVPIADQ